MHLLVVDDDPKFLGYVSRGLQHTGIDCETASNAEAALEALAADRGIPFDLILLDVMMPGRSGWDLLDELRQGGVETPVIFVTARDRVDERVKGLRLGADDYIIKPFAFEELLARIEAVQRRREIVPDFQIGDLKIDLARRRVLGDETTIELSPKEFDLLVCLARSTGRIVTRSELLKTIWDIEFDPGTNLVDVLVGRLRRRLGVEYAGLVQTVAGQGYRLDRETTK